MEEASVSRMEGRWRDEQAMVKQPTRMLGTQEKLIKELYTGVGGPGWGVGLGRGGGCPEQI